MSGETSDKQLDDPASERNEDRAERHNLKSIHAPVMREKERPSDGAEPLPTSLVLIFMALAMWGGWYLGEYGGDFDAMTYSPFSEGRKAVATEAPEIDPEVLGKRVFAQCSACHQASGQGLSGQFPPLVGSERVLGPQEPLIHLLLHGQQGTAVVLGETYNAQMPGWPQLADRELAAVLTYIRNEWGNEAELVSAEAVAAIREDTKGRSKAYSDAELDAIAEKSK